MTGGSAGAEVEDRLGPATVTPIGTFGGIEYLRYDGVFEGTTSTGAFRVPYRINAPADPAAANRTVVLEAPHFAVGTGMLNLYLRPGFLLGRGFVHAAVGWSTLRNRILDPSVPGTFIDGGFHEFGAKVDDEILTDFATVLSEGTQSASMTGPVARQYLTGLSDSTIPLLRLIEDGRAEGVFDLVLPLTAGKGFDPQGNLAEGRFTGKVVVVNSEWDDARDLIDRGVAPGSYRSYVTAGSPHIPDHIGLTAGTNGTSPASFVPELRAHFAQGHSWVTRGTGPPLSTRLSTSRGNAIDRDTAGNAITVDVNGRVVPRLPFVDLGEARYVADFMGSYEAVRDIRALGFRSHQAYAKAFAGRVSAYLRAGFILSEDAEEMRRRAALCSPLTYTETYRDHYAKFVSSTPCAS